MKIFFNLLLLPQLCLLYLLPNTKLSKVSGERLHLRRVTNLLAVENARSESTDVAGSVDKASNSLFSLELNSPVVFAADMSSSIVALKKENVLVKLTQQYLTHFICQVSTWIHTT